MRMLVCPVSQFHDIVLFVLVHRCQSKKRWHITKCKWDNLILCYQSISNVKWRIIYSLRNKSWTTFLCTFLSSFRCLETTLQISSAYLVTHVLCTTYICDCMCTIYWEIYLFLAKNWVDTLIGNSPVSNYSRAQYKPRHSFSQWFPFLIK